jgi:hypothetical protein
MDDIPGNAHPSSLDPRIGGRDSDVAYPSGSLLMRVLVRPRSRVEMGGSERDDEGTVWMLVIVYKMVDKRRTVFIVAGGRQSPSPMHCRLIKFPDLETRGAVQATRFPMNGTLPRASPPIMHIHSGHCESPAAYALRI